MLPSPFRRRPDSAKSLRARRESHGCSLDAQIPPRKIEGNPLISLSELSLFKELRGPPRPVFSLGRFHRIKVITIMDNVCPAAGGVRLLDAKRSVDRSGHDKKLA